MYEPTTGRFNRLDPFFGNHEDPQSFNKYGYVHSDPINFVDPNGEFLISLGIGFAVRSSLRSTNSSKNIAIGTGLVLSAGIETAIYLTALEYWLNGRSFQAGSKAGATSNIEITEFERQIVARWPFPNRDRVAHEIGPPRTGVRILPPGFERFGAGTGTNRKIARDSLAANEFVGPYGCGPCVGVLIVTPTDIIAVHINPGFDSAARTLDALGPYPVGSKLVIAGATNPDDRQFSEYQIAAIRKYAEREDIEIDGFYDSPNIYANSDGEYFDH